MIQLFNFYNIGETMFVQIESLKKDISKAIYHKRKLVKKGRNIKAYKLGKQIDYMYHTLKEMQ